MTGIRRVEPSSESNQGKTLLPVSDLLVQVHRWRRQVGIYSEADEGRLLALLEDMRELGVPRGLAIFIIAGCEWGFRIKAVDRSRNAREALIQEALQQAGNPLHQAGTSLVPEAQGIFEDLTTHGSLDPEAD